MNSRDPNRNASLPLTAEDEVALDALLAEVQGYAPAPPDLMLAILQQLALSPGVASDGANIRLVTRPDAVDEYRGRGVWLALAAGVLAVAAMLMAIFVWAPIHVDVAVIDSNKSAKPLLSATTEPSQLAKSSTPEPTIVGTPDESMPIRRDGMPLVRTDAPVVSPVTPTTDVRARSEVSSVTPAMRSDVSIAKVLTGVNQSLIQYWARVGIAPAGELTDVDLIARVERAFGFQPVVIDGQVPADSQWLGESQCLELAKRLVGGLFAGIPLDRESRDNLVAQASKTISSGEPFDELVASWIADETRLSSAAPNRLAEGVAVHLLDADIRCARCHDSPIDGRFSQADYWSFASVFAAPDRGPLFYELVDGRQRVAQATIPSRWVSTNSETAEVASSINVQPASRATLAKTLPGNPLLARAIVNQLWQIGFGSPLVAGASAIVAPPRDDALLAAQQQLVDSLVASRFDVRDLAVTVIASDAMRRGSFELYVDDKWRFADEADLMRGALAQRTFAADRWRLPELKREPLLAALESHLGSAPGTISSNGGNLLAQPNVDASNKFGMSEKAVRPPVAEVAWAAWLSQRSLVRDSWLHWIDDSAQRQMHAYYAADLAVPDDSDLALKRLSSTADDDAHDRLAWLLLQSQ